MNVGRILVVDDEAQIRRVVRTALVAQGYQVTDARSGEEALMLFGSEEYDLVLLDVNMAGMSGIETCRQIRTGGFDVSVLMVTVRDSESDKVEALDAGADGYVTKPFSIPELVARMRALLRRTASFQEPGLADLRLGDIEISFQARRVIADKERIRLTSKEWDLLSYFAAHANRTLTHQELLQAVWGSGYEQQQQYLHVFINHLRKKIERSPKNPRYLLTEPWVGYRLQVPQ